MIETRSPTAVTRPREPRSPEHLSTVLYDELRELAQREMAGERPDHTLQPTALAHEAWLRLERNRDATFENRAHFFGAAAIAIRRILVEHARRRARLKRGGGAARVDLAAIDPAGPVPDEALLELDRALERLAVFAPDHARIVELRFFAGMALPEIARMKGVSVSTVQREWRLARAWLKTELEEGDGP